MTVYCALAYSLTLLPLFCFSVCFFFLFFAFCGAGQNKRLGSVFVPFCWYFHWWEKKNHIREEVLAKQMLCESHEKRKGVQKVRKQKQKKKRRKGTRTTPMVWMPRELLHIYGMLQDLSETHFPEMSTARNSQKTPNHTNT